MEELKRLNELEKLLGSVCENYEDNCNECPCQKECGEYAKLWPSIMGAKGRGGNGNECY